MSRILNNCTIISELNKNNTINAGCKVTTESKLLSLEVVGFIPISQDDFYDITKFIIGANNIRFDLEAFGSKKEFCFLPIAQKIEKKSNNKLNIDNNFIYIANIKKTERNNLSNYRTYRSEKTKSNLLVSKNFISEKENVYYLLKEDEMSFFRYDKIVGVSNYFLCLCSYINPTTGKLDYTIKNPDELIVVLQKDK
ncbi:MAG: hypothetical protein IKY67_03515 [Paludibacteraceae bacterium]|nr:hypothetical protein [Paludibacteraceae bacterium]